MLRAHAQPAPPEHTDPLAGVVQIRLGDGAGGRLLTAGVVQGAQKKNGAIGVVVSGKMLVFLYIAADIAIGPFDAFNRPDAWLHGRTQPDTDIHSQKTAI